jgi:hydroxyacylglutathione hydrolase
MIVERSEHPTWTSNSYLVAESAGGTGVIVDGNGVAGPLLERVERDRITVTHVLLTHHHTDHVAGVPELAARFGVPVVAHPITARESGVADETVEDGDVVRSGGLEIRAIHTPGHAAGHLAFLAAGTDCFTADVLFRGTVGGTRAPGHTTFADLRSSIMDRLMALDHATRVHPGHTDPTTIGDEWEQNPFIRIWRGLDRESSEPCTVRGRPATLVLWAPDYDGTNKAWVRWPDGGDDIVGGSQVERG